MSSIFDDPMVTTEHWDRFTETDHNTWSLLFNRQLTILEHRAAPEVLEGAYKLDLCSHKIPKFSELNHILKKETGFSVVPVKGIVPDELFFRFLAERKFPSTCFIRTPAQLDYLEEPDIFHDVFGHVPLLVNPTFANFMEEFGKKGLQAFDRGLLLYAARLYWFTVEFGLMHTPAGIRIYGSGITSSKGESIYSLESSVPVRVHFNLHRLIKTQYHVDSFQKTYFVIDNFEQLFTAVHALDWDVIADSCLQFPDIKQGIILNDDEQLR